MNKNYFPFNTPIQSLKTFCFLLVICFSISSYGQLNRIGPVTDFLTPSSIGPFKAAAGVTTLDVKCWGAGGGGGGGSAGLLSLVELGQAGGGGGGGAFSSKNISINWPTSVNPSFNYNVGLGGAGGSTDGIDGGNGDKSFFENATVTVKAGGGGGGKGSVLITNTGGGLGSTDGDKNGGNGGAAYLIPLSLFQVGINRSGGGGGSAGTSLNGNSASGLTGGIAVTGGAAGGNGGQKTGNLLGSILNLVLSDDVLGSPGGFPGGGGGGGGGGVGNGLLGGLLNPGAKNSNGGKGGDGKITVGYTCPEYSITGSSTDASCTQTSTIVLTGNLPIGTYEISYNISSGAEVTVPMEVSTSGGTGSITVSGLPVSGSSTVAITKIKSEGCWTTVSFPITFNRPIKPIVDKIIHPTCAEPKGSVTFSGLVIGSIIHQTGVANATYPITANPQTIRGLDSGNYNFVVSNGVCSSQTVSDVTTVSVNNPPPTITWNGSNWTPGTPTIENKVIFANSYNEDPENLDEENVDIEACSCEVKSGAQVTFIKERYLKIRNELAVDPNGSLTFENKASLVQINDAAINSGKIIYKRITPSLIETDYTYWSSPVLNQTLNISPDYTYGTFYSFDSNNWAEKNTTTPMLLGKGYIIRGQRIDNTPYTITGTFTGVPNNGALTTAIGSANTLNLIGNPYPSALDASTFLNVNSSMLYGTIYFWTHATAIQAASGIAPGKAGSGDYAYTSDDYASYNITGGVGTGNFKNGVEQTVNKPTGKIASGQAFFAYSKAATATNVIFNNSMRVGVGSITGNNSQFYRQSSSAKTTAATIEKNRVWLNLTNKQGAFKQALVGYITGATNEYDDSFDGVSFNGNTFVDFYSVNNDVNLTIQGRALPFEQKDSVSLGYRSTIKGEFQISIDQKDGKLLNQQVFLEDQLVQVLHDLKTPYSFETEIGTFNDRFVLRYEDKNAITENIDDLQITAVSISTKDKKIDIKTTDSLIDKVYIYNFSGNLVYSDAEINATTTVISNLLVDHSALIVHVVLENGKKTVKKIMY